MYGDKFDVRILLSPTATKDAVNSHLVEAFDYVIDEVTEEVIEELLNMIEQDKTDQKYLMIFDDVVGSLPQNRNGKPDILSTLATKYRHVGNEQGEGKLSIFLATQYFKFLTPTLRNNASAYFLCGNSSELEDKGMAENLSVFGGSEKEFKRLLKEAKKNKFDFAYLDMKRLKFWKNFEKVLFEPDIPS